jgi:hypothetical protein
MGSIDLTIIQISREGSTKRYMGILFVPLIIRNIKFNGMMGKNKGFFLTASQRSCLLLHCLQIFPLLFNRTILSFPHRAKPWLMKRKK